jgi:signal transduction histidine kinase
MSALAPGRDVPPASTARAKVVERGVRLDEREEGAGLGLAIVKDVLDADGRRLTLATSDGLGGSKMTIMPATAATG